MIMNIHIEEYGSGVYILMNKGSILYIGQTQDLNMRIAQHRKSGKAFDKILFMPCHKDDHDAIEGDLIREFEPERNRNARGYMHCPAKRHGFNSDEYIKALRSAIHDDKAD